MMTMQDNKELDQKDRPKVRIAFLDFWSGFRENMDNIYFLEILRRDFDFVEDYEDPDFVLCSTFGCKALEYNCPRIQWIGEAISCNFNDYDYIVGFDRMSFGDRYIRLPLYLFHNHEADAMKLARGKHLRPDSFYDAKDKFCAFVVSSPFDINGRAEFFKSLDAQKHVDSAGLYLNNLGGQCCEDKVEFLKNYRFNIAFENSSMEGYVTEKISEAFAAGCIPIYCGAPDVELDFNKGAFINASDFGSFGECIDYVLYVDSHPEVYRDIIRQPALLENQTLDKTFEKDLLDFFHNIFDREPAIRRPINVYGTIHASKSSSIVSVVRRCLKKIYRHN